MDAERSGSSGSGDPADAVQRRFSAKRLPATRKKPGLSEADFVELICVTGQSLYNWESGEGLPRAKQLNAIASVLRVGKREAAARLEVIRELREQKQLYFDSEFVGTTVVSLS
ncbi:MAG: family transcriptional regulator [Bryobacterales bacterium]|nr:family transcriptional regulator [Bryobacterales bacterium]